MCGILALFGESVDTSSHLLTHRGPDDYRTQTLGKCQMDFYRLAINDLTDTGMQPFRSESGMLICNGEIYNHKELASGYEKGKSDCEVLIHLIEKYGILEASKMIKGDFALVYTDGKRVLASRDPFGVRPMFYTRYDDGCIAFASEIKALRFLKTRIDIFPPGHIYDSYIDDFVAYYPIYWNVSNGITTGDDMRKTLENAVRIRLNNTQRDVGFLLSGGLDSSLIASIATRKLGKIKTFSIGLKGSPDLDAARKVAKYLDTEHTEINFTPKEGLSVLKDVIRSLESYDTTTVRASVPMWLLCKYIKNNTTCRYIFSGEGSDEVLGGYLYFKNAPGVDAFACENMRRLRLIHQFDCLRSDRCSGAHGLDMVVPFLDKDFVELCMTMDQGSKIADIEKNVLRQAFVGYLPDEILWRQKDAMSDAVGTNWVKELKRHADKVVSVIPKVNHNTPLTKEEALYRTIFWDLYDRDSDHLITEIWRPKWTKIKDPSARLLLQPK